MRNIMLNRKPQSTPSKIMNKTKVSIHSTVSQYGALSLSYNNRQEKEKGHIKYTK